MPASNLQGCFYFLYLVAAGDWDLAMSATGEPVLFMKISSIPAFQKTVKKTERNLRIFFHPFFPGDFY